MKDNNMTERDKHIIKIFIDCNGNATAAAKELYMHRNSVLYHLRKIKLKTSLDPNNFRDLMKLSQLVGI